MSRHLGIGRRSRARRASCSTRRTVHSRQPRFETLESRHLLSVTLPALLGQTVYAGAPLNLALNGSSSAGNKIDYTVSVNNSTLANSAELTATVPEGNPSLRISVSDPVDGIAGDMVFQLFKDLAPETVAQIKGLVDDGFYDGLTFHRVISDFVIQGGDPSGNGTGGPGFTYDSEINAALQFTSSGILGMANSGPDTNGSQFFVTSSETRWLDFRYPIFGFLTQGDSIRAAIESVATDSNDKPVNNVTMTDVTTFIDTQNGVLRLSAPAGVTGSAEVTVVATDSVTGEQASQVFHVVVASDTNVSPPFLDDIEPIQTTVNTPVTFTIPAIDLNNRAKRYTAVISPANSNVVVSVNSTTGQATITPTNGATGVFGVKLGVAAADPVSGETYTEDTQVVPIYVNPREPTSVTLTSTSDTGDPTDKLTNLNNTPGKTLQFQVDGVLSGAKVELFAYGMSIGSATASGTSVVVTTNGTVTLADGTRWITAKQTLVDQAVNIGNLDTTTDLASAATAPISIRIDVSAPVLTAAQPLMGSTDQDTAKIVNLTGTFINNGAGTTTITDTTVGTPVGGIAIIGMTGAGTWAYSLDGTTFTDIDELTPATALLLAKTAQLRYTPDTFNSEKPTITYRAWNTTTGISGQRVDISNAGLYGGSTAFSADTDTATLNVNNAPVLTPVEPVGTIHKNTPVTVSLDAFFGEDLFANVSDANGNAVSGIAVVGMTGSGNWSCSLDGKRYQNITTISSSMALLLPATARIRYTPDQRPGTATITYRAWDMTNGASGKFADLSASSSRGGTTAFSAVTETVTIVVADIKDATVMIQASPSLGCITTNSPKTISLTGTFINNGVGTTTIGVLNPGAVAGGIALTDAAGNGTWEYSIDNGATFQEVLGVGDDAALLLNKNAKLRYTPAGVGEEGATITYRAWDTTSGTNGEQVDISGDGDVGGSTAYSFFADTATLTVNTAPVLTPASPALVLGASTEDAAATTIPLAAFINDGMGTTTIADADQDPYAGGIALVATTGNGTWEYSTDGVTFQAVGTASAASALLLSPEALLRFTPDGANGGAATITYRAWDMTSGTAGARADLSDSSAIGGATPFSVDCDTGTFVVVSRNDAPILSPATPSLGSTYLNAAHTISLSSLINNGASTTTISDVDTGAIVGGIALTGITGNGTWSYSLDGTTFQSVGTVSAASALLLPSTAMLMYTPTGTGAETPTIIYRAWDTTSGVSGGRADLSGASAVGGETAFSIASDMAVLTVTEDMAPNEAPSFVAGPDQAVDMNSGPQAAPAWATSISAGSTSEAWQNLDFIVTTSNDALFAVAPAIDVSTGTLTYTPAPNSFGVATVTVRLHDDGGTAGGGIDTSAPQTFTITLRPLATGPWLAGIETDALPYVENDPATTVTESIVAVDLRGPNLTRATIQITGNYRKGEDVLSFVNTRKIKAKWNSKTGTLTLSGTDTVANYEAALRTVKYRNTSNSPIAAERTVTFHVNGGKAASNKVARTIAVTAVDDAPTLAKVETKALAYKKKLAAVTITKTIKVADVDNTTLASASVQIIGNYRPNQDVLSFVDTARIKATWLPITGELRLAGADTVANYQKALRAVKYQNLSDRPSMAIRTIAFAVSDGLMASNVTTRTIQWPGTVVTAVSGEPPAALPAVKPPVQVVEPTVTDAALLAMYWSRSRSEGPEQDRTSQQLLFVD